ncbi:hypothetical protein D7Z54_03435 [Salibacterium salarium]|uniref:Uncharacterized protein n=1 Tax=Salibacterium salarium TaxID=284579 RepID=A0A3R9WWA5_9BACI|nr:hypothetical protein [Salibacterium salarium]RSL34897.1 hypothetical protein D7Z54_03435 [Salibacterium salarium]
MSDEVTKKEKLFNPEVNKSSKLSFVLMLLIVFVLLQITSIPSVIVLSYATLIIIGFIVFHVLKIVFYTGKKKGKDIFMTVIAFILLGWAMTLF